MINICVTCIFRQEACLYSDRAEHERYSFIRDLDEYQKQNRKLPLFQHLYVLRKGFFCEYRYILSYFVGKDKIEEINTRFEEFVNDESIGFSDYVYGNYHVQFFRDENQKPYIQVTFP